MEQNGSNQNMPSSMLCTRGCGFYGNPSHDGMCSKCYKDMVKRRQHNPSPNANLLSSAPASLAPSEPRDIVAALSSASALPVASSLSTTEKDTNKADDCKQTLSLENISLCSPSSNGSEAVADTTASVETGSPTVPSVAAAIARSSEDRESSVTSTDTASDASGRKTPADQDKKPKKNRCHACKKKVGLTGFQCRCGGLYCGLHRYSDKHDCTFDYKEMAQEEIRKANPVIVGAKVQKI